MRNFFMTLLLALVSTAAFSQLETYGRFNEDGTVEPDINYFVASKISEKTEVTFYSQNESGWSEALIGLNHYVKPWFSIGISGGLEHNPAIYRLGASIWMGSDSVKTSFTLMGEKGDGNDNYWYKAIVAHKTSGRINLGAIAWRYHGIGPFLEYKFKKSKFSTWVMPAYDAEYEMKRVIVGIKYKI
jgi:hypothetical protein